MNIAPYPIVILANGEPPSHLIPLNILKKAEKIICCDGAIHTLRALHLTPYRIIGDLDSIHSDYYIEYKDIIIKDDDPEYNDLNKALRYCLQHNEHSIAIIGGNGLREDHALNNLGVMIHYAEKGMRIEMISNYGVFTPIFTAHTFQSFKKQQVSVFSFSPEVPLTFHGLKYPVNHRCFRELWEGALNEALDDTFEIHFDNGKVLIYRSF